MADVLLCCSASVSVYKVCDLASKLTQAGHRVRTVLTENAAKLVSPQLFEAVTGEPAFVSEWGDARRSAMDHIDLSRFAEIVVVAPCSANLAARLALSLEHSRHSVPTAWGTPGLWTQPADSRDLRHRVELLEPKSSVMPLVPA